MDGGFLIAAAPVAVAASAQPQAATEGTPDAGFQEALNRSMAALTPATTPKAGLAAPSLLTAAPTEASVPPLLAPSVAPVAAVSLPAGAMPSAGEVATPGPALAPQPDVTPHPAILTPGPLMPEETSLMEAPTVFPAETPEPGPAMPGKPAPESAAPLPLPAITPTPPEDESARPAVTLPTETLPTGPIPLAPEEVQPEPEAHEPEAQGAEQEPPAIDMPIPPGPQAATLPLPTAPSLPEEPAPPAPAPAPAQIIGEIPSAVVVAAPVIQPRAQLAAPTQAQMASEAEAEGEALAEVDLLPPMAPAPTADVPATDAPRRSARDDASTTLEPKPAEARPTTLPTALAGTVTSWGFEVAPARMVEAPPPASSPPPPPMRQVAPIAIALAFTPGVANGFQLSLDPVELGRVEIRVQREGETHSVRVVAERPETLALLLRDRQELDRNLADAGLRVEARGIEFALGSQSGSSDQRQQGEARPGATHRGGAPAQASDTEPPPARAMRGLLDLNI